MNARSRHFSLLAIAGLVCGCQATGSAVPQGAVQPTTATSSLQHSEGFRVVKRDLRIVYRLDGRSAPSTSVHLPVPGNMNLLRSASLGQRVVSGSVLGRIVPDQAVVNDYRSEARSSSVAASQLAALERRQQLLRAPVSGVIEGSGSDLQILASGIDAVVTLTPLQELRYRSLPFRGWVDLETVFGQRTVGCRAIWIEASSDATGNGTTYSDLHCRIPADVETAPGLPLVVTLKSRVLRDVIALPAIYVGMDSSARNYVVRVRAGSRVMTRKVVVGATDGVVRVIVAGLRRGEIVLPAKEVP